MSSFLRFLDHGKQDLQLLRLKGQDLLRVLVEGCGLDLLGELPKVWGQLEALDVAPKFGWKRGF